MDGVEFGYEVVIVGDLYSGMGRCAFGALDLLQRHILEDHRFRGALLHVALERDLVLVFSKQIIYGLSSCFFLFHTHDGAGSLEVCS